MYILILLTLFVCSIEENEYCLDETPYYPQKHEIIEDGRFKNCFNFIGDINIPDHITYIGAEAFYNCWGFNGTLNIPESVTTISDNAFYNCTGLKRISFKSDNLDNIGASCFENCISLEALKLPNSRISIGEYAFANCTGLKGDLILPLFLQKISQYTFKNCYNLDGMLKIDTNVKEIEPYAFDNCNKLSGNLTIPDSVTSIGNNAFYKCSSFTTIVLGNKIESIGQYAFYDCTKLSGSLKVPNSAINIGDYSFFSLGFIDITLGEKLDSIGQYAFANCNKIKCELNIPDSLKSIGDFSFCNCSLISSLNFGQNLESIGNSAFLNCLSLAGDLIFNDNLKQIGNNAFYGCTKLDGLLNMSNSLMNIGSNCFFGLNKIKGSIILPEIILIGESAFEGCSSLSGSIEISENCEKIGKRAFALCGGCAGQLILSKKIEILEEFTFYKCSSLSGSLVITDSIKSIGNCCFKDCSSFSKLEFGVDPKLELIYKSSFENCIGFKGNLDFPIGVTKIFESAFSNCSGFDGTLTFNEAIETIGNDAFSYCSRFSKLQFSQSSSLKIGDRAFYYCSGFKGSLDLSNGVSDIGKSAFEYCSGFDKLVPSSSLKIVQERTFYCCSGFKGEFDFSSYTELCDEAFCGCSGFNGKLVLCDIIYHNAVFANCSGFTSIDFITNKVSSINSYTFKGCTGLSRSLLFSPNTIVYDNAFEGCNKIKEINSNEISLFYPYAFSDCTSLIGPIIFSNTIETIPEGVFYNCISIKSITLNEKIKYIRKNAFYNCKSLNSALTLPSSITGIDEFAFANTNIPEIVFFPPMPPNECASNAFPSNKKLSLSDIYIYNDFCGTIINGNEGDDKRVVIPPSPSINELIEKVEINEETDDPKTIAEKITKAFEKLRNEDANSLKIVVVDSPNLIFSSTLNSDEYIKIADEKNVINFKEGKLNVILDPDLPLNITFDESNTANKLSCKGSGSLNLLYEKQSNVIIFNEKFDINGTINIETDSNADVVLDSVKLSNKGVFRKNKGNLIINNLDVSPYTNFSFERAKINNMINIQQTANLEFSDQIDIQNATINYQIHGFGPSNPIIKGYLYSIPQKIVLQKLNDDLSPDSDKNIIFVSGWFYNSSCDSWLDKVDFGNSGFNKKFCHTTNTSTLIKILEDDNRNEVYQSLVVSYSKTDEKGTKLSIGAIIGIVVGCVALVAIIIITVILIVKKKKQQVSNSE